MNRAASIVVISVLALPGLRAALPHDDPDGARGASDSQLIDFSDAEIRRILTHAMPPPPPSATNAWADNAAAAHLGQYLFFDTRFSSNGEISCATCHDPAQDFTDGAQLGRGIGTMPRHTPSLLNVAYNRWFFWDGRADSLWSQSLEPIEHELEYGGNRLRVAHVIHGDPELRVAYERLFGPMPDLDDASRFPPDARPRPQASDDPQHRAWEAMARGDQEAVNRVFVNIGKCIEAYERRLISGDSPFDQFLSELQAGDSAADKALSIEAQRGLKLFIGEANCRLCHAGPGFTDGEFHNTGVPPLDPALRDSGRYDGIRLLQSSQFTSGSPFSDAVQPSSAAAALKRSAETWGQFKTPTLRNAAETPPYMHQGQFATLGEVLRFYSTREGAVAIGHHQESILDPLNLTDAQLSDLEAFLRSLSGRPLDASLLVQPKSPLLNLDSTGE
jgi:cytochrome c peroxidase